MISKPISVLEQYPVRKTKKQKNDFREDVKQYLESIGYPVNIEKGSFGARNAVAGNPENAKCVIAAHYDTPAGLPFPNLITPCNLFTFSLWQIATLVFMLILPFIAYWLGTFVTSGFSFGTWFANIILIIEFVFMMIGPANKTNANDNTSGVVTVLSIAENLPVELRDKVCFVLFDLEEAGLLGSSSYAKKYSKSIENQIVLNFDCVGDGNNIVFFPTKQLLKDEVKMKWLEYFEGVSEDVKSITIRRNGFSFYPSDQVNFPYGVGIAALNKSKRGILFCDKIHTKKDTVLDESNIAFICKNTIMTLENIDELPESSQKNNLNSRLTKILFFTTCVVIGFILGIGLGILGL